MVKEKRSDTKIIRFNFWLVLFLILGVFLVLPTLSHAADSLCAVVKIEIRQELTLERQAFDAHMTINNGLSHITLEDVEVEVSFTDEDGEAVLASSNPDNTSALFFIREDSDGITDNGDGTWAISPVNPSSSADLHWLIIPAPGASNGLESGTLYYVGAKLTYTISGEENTTEVNPDYIYVKPLPELVLDYFLPNDVYGDDAFTPEIEPPIPFSLGVRVKNTGFGTARSLKIDSAQPEIVENELGLLIGFLIEGSTVNGAEATDSLLVDFGDISPNTAGVARWIMTCTLSGRFIDFEAEFSHSDELGGELTSLIVDPINTHFLVRDVLVDKAGRDTRRDFLALDGSVYRVYESDTIDTEVPDQSAASSLQFDGNSGSESRYTLTTAVNAGFVYIKLADPHGGQKVLKEAYRSDGKQIKTENVWLSKTREGSGPWQHFINLFDSDTTGTYTVIFEDPSATPQPPVLQFIPDKSRTEGEQVSFLVEASDPNGTIPTLSAYPLPVGATFTDNGDGTGVFDWTPAIGQAGQYIITFTASDGTLTHSRRMKITVFSVNDTDNDGMDDTWEMDHFGTLDHDGTGDFDGDGISDLEEYLLGTDPTQGDNAPSVPVILSPADGEEVTVLSPALTVENSTDPEADPITYEFEVFSDPGMTNPVASRLDVAETVDTTSWTVTASLDDNHWYYWRVRATDRTGSSLWAYGSFFVNTQNDAPGPVGISRPLDTFHVGALTPELEVTNSPDADEDPVTYAFEVYTDAGMGSLVTSVSGIPEGEAGTTGWLVDAALSDNTTYYWRAIATDEHGAWTETGLVSFYVDTSNTAPEAPTMALPALDSEVTMVDTDLVINNATDAEGDPLTYYFELDRTATFDSPEKLSSGAVSEGPSTTTWQVTGLSDNSLYYWRARADDGANQSPWVLGRFFVNTVNDCPPIPTLKNPGENAWVKRVVPSLEVNPVLDPDNDGITYYFELYSDASLSSLVAELSSETGSAISPELSNLSFYFWRARAEDAHGLSSQWTDTASFFVKSDGVNLPPQITVTQPSEDVLTNGDILMIEWEDDDPDSNAIISLYYDTDGAGYDGTLIVGNITEDPFGMGNSYPWVINAIEGTYYIYAIIADEESTASSYAPGAVTIDRTPPMVQALPAGGSYTQAQSVLLSTDEAADIYYTTDGTDPTTGSAVYSAPIEVTDTTTLKFMAVDALGNQSAVVTEDYTITASQDLTIVVSTDDGTLLSGINVYAFTEAGTYTGKNAVTDGNGTAVFVPEDFTPDSYKFRADYLGSQFWSAPVAVPGTAQVDLTIEVETVQVTVTTAAGISAGTTVYLFSESGAYLGISGVTDASGVISFDLPTGISFKFRADILGSQYFSPVTLVSSGGTNNVAMDAGGGVFTVTVQEDLQTPMAGITAYLFSVAGTYLGKNAVSDSSGVVTFDVPEGSYKVRADYLGYQFWSNDTLVQADTAADITIAHQDVTVTVNGVFSAPEPIEGVTAYLFTGAGTYMNRNQVTDQNGRVIFHVPQKAYKVRADFMSRQFWSEEFVQADKTIDIPMADAQVFVGWSTFGLPDVPVYAFTASGTYLNMNGITDGNGIVTFRVPAGTYEFRADYQASQFWSAETDLVAYEVNPVDISTGGGSFVFTVLKNATDPLVGVNCHVFNEDGVYFGVYGPTSSDGEVTFDLADGNYNIRVDYLGYQFWSNLYDVPTTLSDTFIIPHQDVGITVNGLFQGATPLEGLTVYLFTSGEMYQGQSRVTDANGQVSFYVPDKEYKVRVDYLNQQHWSDPFVQTDMTVDIPMADAEITVTGSGLPLEGMPVYAFSETETYLNISGATDIDGKVTFRLPAGSYKFRTDYQSSQYWSGVETLTAQQVNPVGISTGGGTFVFTVLKNAGDPLVGVPCYLFNEAGAYLGTSATTSSEGQVSFDLADGTYKFRVDHLGYQFWSNVYTVPDVLSDIFTLTHQDVTITVNNQFQGATQPMEGLTVYLFKPSGAYMSRNQVTDADGQAVFNLPNEAYQVRADYLSRQFWSGEFTWTDTTVTIPMADAEVTVTGGGQVLEGVPVYVFNASGTYLGINNATDINGQVTFRLPAETYKFRADYQSSQYWSNEETLTADQVNPVAVSTGGGMFTLTVLKGAADPLVGASCYAFNEQGTYLGMSGTTDGSGQVQFSFADGNYKFRVDHLGYQFWTNVYTVPTTLSDDFMIQHTDVTVTVEGVYQTPAPMEGLTIYLFTSSGTYMNQNQVTDANGQVVFNIPDQVYKVRADYLGRQFWSGDFQSQDTTVTIDEGLARIHVHRSGVDQAGATVYLFSETGAYLGKNKVTDTTGIAEFILPDVPFQFRADEGGAQVWSGVVDITAGLITNIDIDLN